MPNGPARVSYLKAERNTLNVLERIRILTEVYYTSNKDSMPDYWQRDFGKCLSAYTDAKQKEEEAFNAWVNSQE